MTIRDDQMIYAIGDIHGFIDQLENALALIQVDGGDNAHIVFLGDYTDRGPDSRAVVQRLLDGVAAGRNWTVLRGNHDRMFCRYVTQGIEHDDRIKSGKGWLTQPLGGRETLKSYGVDPDAPNAQELAAQNVPADHIAFLQSRDLWLETDDKIFVHAGILPNTPMDQQIEDDLIWIREGYLDYTAPHAKLIVHGHTAMETPTHFGNRVDLDGGAGYGRPLVPAVFDGTDCYTLTEGGRVPLLPLD